MIKTGDYVLATKYQDGDPRDQFCIGFYDKPLSCPSGQERHLVTNRAGDQFRANGFRRVEKISEHRGEFLIANLKEISEGSRSLWWWKRAKIGV